jgi:hypothetical protein
MSKDVERLFRNINQADIPYRVFEPPSVPSPAIGHAEPEPEIAPELTTWPTEAPPAAARSQVFRKYRESAEPQPAAQSGPGTPLKPIFDRIRERCQAAEAERAKPSA